MLQSIYDEEEEIYQRNDYKNKFKLNISRGWKKNQRDTLSQNIFIFQSYSQNIKPNYSHAKLLYNIS